METEFKVGEKVVITKSSENWNVVMDKFDGRIVTITEIDTKGFTSIKFRGSGGWYFCEEHGHFRKLEAKDKKRKREKHFFKIE